VLVAAVIGAGLVASCAGSAGTAEPPATVLIATTTASPGTTQPRWNPRQQEVVDAYLAADDAETIASQGSDPDATALLATHIDPLLAKLRDTYGTRRAKDQRTRFPDNSKYRMTIEKVDVSSESFAHLTNCTIDDAIVFETTTGQVVNDQLVAARLDATLIQKDGRWSLSERNVLATWKDSTKCDD
jgi:hypothetical protein